MSNNNIHTYEIIPFRVEAIQLNADNIETVRFFLGESFRFMFGNNILFENENNDIFLAEIGDYIVKLINGNYYQCECSVFENTFKKTEER